MTLTSRVLVRDWEGGQGQSHRTVAHFGSEPLFLSPLLFTYCLLTTEDSLVGLLDLTKSLPPYLSSFCTSSTPWPHFTLKDIPSRPYLEHTCSFQCGDTHRSLFLPHNCGPSWPFLESCFNLCFGPVILLEHAIYLFVTCLLDGRSWFAKLYIYLAGRVPIFIILIPSVELLQCRAPCSEEGKLYLAISLYLCGRKSSMSSELRFFPLGTNHCSIIVNILSHAYNEYFVCVPH